tara:strand:- start:53 stop:424 length:372 start_codon:yes stop_codon:yes gene_type:complete
MEEKEIEKILNKYATRGYASHFCKGCLSYTLSCPECGASACSASSDCGSCIVTFREHKNFLDEIDEATKDDPYGFEIQLEQKVISYALIYLNEHWDCSDAESLEIEELALEGMLQRLIKQREK